MKLFSLVLARCCTVLTLVITAIALLSSHLSGSYLLALLSPFQVQYFVTTVLLGAITLLSNQLTSQSRNQRTQQVRLLIPILFCITLLSANIAPWYLPSFTPATTSIPYRVISTNLNVANSNAAATLELIEQEQPDLAVFIEVNDEMATQLDALKASLPFSSNQLTQYQPGAVVYSKHPLSDFAIQKFNTNNAVNLTMTIQVGALPIALIAVHPFPPINTTLLQMRNTAFEAISTYVQKQNAQQQKNPVLMIGDFNVTMWSPYYKKLEQQTGLNNSRKHFGVLPSWPANMANYFNPAFSWLSPLIQIPIDHCLASDALNVTDMRIASDVGSDHLPIVVDFSLPQEAGV